MSLHPFRALVLQPGLTPELIITLQQVAELVVTEGAPAVARSRGTEADLLHEAARAVTAPVPDRPSLQRFCGTPGETHGRLLRLAAIAIAEAERIARSFDVAPNVPLSTEQRMNQVEAALGVRSRRATDAPFPVAYGNPSDSTFTLPCDTEPSA